MGTAFSVGAARGYRPWLKDAGTSGRATVATTTWKNNKSNYGSDSH